MPLFDRDTGWTEAHVVINDKPLTFAESMALRVAVSSFRMWLSAHANRDGIGPLAEGYDSKLQSIERKMFGRE